MSTYSHPSQHSQQFYPPPQQPIYTGPRVYTQQPQYPQQLYAQQQQPLHVPAEQQYVRRDPFKDLHVTDKLARLSSAFNFFLLTLVMVADIATDVWVIILFGIDGDLQLLGASVVILAFSGIMSGIMYILTMKSKMLEHKCSMATCLACNFPLHIGIILARFLHTATKFGAGCKETKPSKEHKDWTFAKIKLAQGTFQSIPMFMINLFSIFILRRDHTGQYISAIVSIVSIAYGSVVHEFVRKERLGGEKIGPIQGPLIFLYMSLILVGRLVTIEMFLFYYRGWVGAILLLHLALMAIYFFMVYREVWKVGLDRIFLHAIYCVFAYFPVHNEYRPDGEIMIFYAVFMIENVLMISLPHGIRPRALVPIEYGPNTDFYTIVTCVVLVGSLVGLCLMGIYYFLFHRSAEYIRDTHLSCCTCFDCLDKHIIGVKPVPRDENMEVSSGVPQQPRLNSVQPTYHSSMDMLAGKRQRLSTTDLTFDDVSYKEPLSESDMDRSVFSDTSSGYDGHSTAQKQPRRQKPRPAPRTASRSDSTEHETSSSYEQSLHRPGPAVAPKPAPRRQPSPRY